jgi:hypothetical protein
MPSKDLQPPPDSPDGNFVSGTGLSPAGRTPNPPGSFCSFSGQATNNVRSTHYGVPLVSSPRLFLSYADPPSPDLSSLSPMYEARNLYGTETNQAAKKRINLSPSHKKTGQTVKLPGRIQFELPPPPGRQSPKEVRSERAVAARSA